MRRTFALALAPICLVVAMTACGSDEKESPSTTVTNSTIGGQQAPGPGGNNNSGNDNPIPSAGGETQDTTAPGAETPDTQEKIDDGTPGMAGSAP